jgi:hypothetical protein
MHSIDHEHRPQGRIRARLGRIKVALGASAILSLTAVTAVVGGAGASGQAIASAASASNPPVRAILDTPAQGEKVASGFSVNVELDAKNAMGNRLLSGYKTKFVDPTGPDGMGNPSFHPGASAVAPGLVVTLSTTPRLAGTPLVGPRTNLAGVFQINSVTRVQGLIETWNNWQVTSPGFFGKHTSATMTVYAVRDHAPDAVPARGLTPISNVVKHTFRIGS